MASDMDSHMKKRPVATPPTAEGVSLWTLMHEDLQAIFERDPSATSLRRVLLYSAGLRIVWGYRWQHWLWMHNHRFWSRQLHKRMRKRYACDIHPAAQIGRRFVVDHGVGVVIGQTAIVGDDCLIYQGATLGMTGKSFSREGKRHPTLGNHVLVGANAIVLGNITVGDHVNIGAGDRRPHELPRGRLQLGPLPADPARPRAPARRGGQAVRRGAPHRGRRHAAARGGGGAATLQARAARRLAGQEIRRSGGRNSRQAPRARPL